MIMYYLAYALFYSLNLQNPASVPPATNSRLSPLPHEPADYDRGATVDIPLDNPKVKQNNQTLTFVHFSTTLLLCLARDRIE